MPCSCLYQGWSIITHLTDSNGIYNLKTGYNMWTGQEIRQPVRLTYPQDTVVQVIGQFKSNVWIINPDYTPSIQDPIAERLHPGEIPSKPRIQWPKSNQRTTWSNVYQEHSLIVTNHLRGPISQQNRSFCKVVHEVCLVWFGVATSRGDMKELNRPNRR